MNKVVFVYPKIEFEENYPNSWIPFSILTLGTSIMNNNIELKIFDQNKSDVVDLYNYIDINKNDIMCVVFSIMTGGAQISNALKIAKYVKENNIITAFGGPHVNVLPEQTAKHELVDYALKGLGQFQFPIFIDGLMNKSKMDMVPGIYFYNGNRLIIGPDNVVKGLYLPNYNINLIEIEKYIQNDNTINTRTINYIASQGCPYTCKFCYETCYDRKYFKIKEEDILSDIEFLIDKYNVNGIKFYDADWFVDIKRSIRMAERIKDYNIKWAASINPRDILRTSNGLESNLLDMVKKSGCSRLLMGMESGNNRVLKEIVDKRVTKEELMHVARMISKYQILGSYTFIVGFPGETDKEIDETFSFVEKLWSLETKPETRVHIYTPYPGTSLYDQSLELGFKAPDSLEGWSKFDYYKSMTPWTSKDLERKVKECTVMIEKKKVRKK
ncbi:MAG: radical SAM protein [Bacilli bacterium]|nr:radical SAM protein [Bacilli bacterium]